MQKLKISSFLHFKATISKFFSTWIICKTYCLAEENITVESEIEYCFNSNITISKKYLIDRLPYIPIKEIEFAMSNSRNIFLISNDIYTHISKMNFDEKECQEIYISVKKSIDSDGFVSLSSIIVSENEKINPQLTVSSMKYMIFSRYLSDMYDRTDNIIYPKDSNYSFSEFIKNYCTARKTTTRDELHSLELEFSDHYHNHAIKIANDFMVRINYDIFIRDNEVPFDIDATDRAIAPFMRKDVIPLQDVTSFTAFPLIKNFTWNWFLLESFCRRFSKLFQYECLAVNSCNVGAIYKKSVGFISYHHVLARVLLDDSVVPLDVNTVGDYLFEKRYVAQRTVSINKIIELAQSMIEK